ncbi:RsmB/NOP family class I SAM-dependent RNA methyltransferase [Pseudodesulfovibrio sp. zrk46]|uniref:RsmB/NOP family class I SAM-dependent RNA methyltransferase n=1 Tax=Pseudodesulfovibrio sp. zrk46 TaxID=2725288 RepID=UPI001449F015|nr:RsmB/NOP family class I SAM-dependent RNA methyltransferase [Pseudodesulfovibrio sp. zrk46]QJB56633.1 RsmB/NOP family class I SAM-dependent RNA methyltransferase [Pseudodesulfovibrio sp. zrk46]
MPNEFRTFRLVCDKADTTIVEDLLKAQGFSFEPEPFYAMARKLTHEPFPLGESLAARFGLIYIQDRSSMLPPLLLAPPKGSAVLDMCSAPGSKTSLLSRLVGRDGFVFASEPSADRLGTLRANLRRTGSVNAATAKVEAQKLPFPDCSWDYIQLDPPCSGWGTVDKNPKVMELWSESKTGPLVTLQKALLTKAEAMLSPGGSVLFSTCTTNIEENEEQVAWAVEELGLELVPLAEPKGFVFGDPLLPGMDGVLRVAEDSDGQGFFLARFRKKDTECAESSEEVQKRALPGQRIDLRKVEGGKQMNLDNLPPGEVYDFGGKVFFLHDEAVERVPASLRWQGALLGKLVGRGERAKFLPDGAAKVLLSEPGLKGGPDVLDVEEPLPIEQMLSGQSLSFKPGKGPVGLFYRGLPLGWLSRKGRRLMMSSK